MRTLAYAAAALALLSASACGGNRARDLSVTILDSADVVCEPVASEPFVNEAAVKDLAEAQERSIKRTAETYPLTPLGRTLHVVETDTTTAWFEGSDNNLGALSTNLRLDPNEVYEGPARDEYVEGTYEDLRDTCPFVPSKGDPCGVIPVVRATLTLTIDDDGVLGRIRLTDSYYSNPDPANPYDTRVECTRNLSIEGAETR